MRKPNPPKQPKAANEAKDLKKVAQPRTRRPATVAPPKAQQTPSLTSKARPTPAPIARPKAKAKSAAKAKVTVSPKSPATAAPDVAPIPSGKLGILVQMLQRPQGASVYDLAEAVGWNTNSIRGAMAGALKARGFVITSQKLSGVRLYRIAPPPKASVRGRR